MYINLQIYLNIKICINIHIYICVYIYIHILYLCIYMYIHMYIYIPHFQTMFVPEPTCSTTYPRLLVYIYPDRFLIPPRFWGLVRANMSWQNVPFIYIYIYIYMYICLYVLICLGRKYIL
jgi:hypothetical protein